MMCRFVLASRSPRRKDLLGMLGIKDLVVLPAENEEGLDPSLSPEEGVRRIALAKAREVSDKVSSDSVVIAADTLVWADGVPLGKPRSREEAFSMLRTLSGRRHTVCTGVAVLTRGSELSDTVSSQVYFRSLSDAEISDYIATGEPMDKAGAYGIQGLGSLLVEKIDGDFFNVMGLPVCRLNQMLRSLGIDILRMDKL